MRGAPCSAASWPCCSPCSISPAGRRRGHHRRHHPQQRRHDGIGRGGAPARAPLRFLLVCAERHLRAAGHGARPLSGCRRTRRLGSDHGHPERGPRRQHLDHARRPGLGAGGGRPRRHGRVPAFDELAHDPGRLRPGGPDVLRHAGRDLPRRGRLRGPVIRLRHAAGIAGGTARLPGRRRRRPAHRDRSVLPGFGRQRGAGTGHAAVTVRRTAATRDAAPALTTGRPPGRPPSCTPPAPATAAPAGRGPRRRAADTTATARSPAHTA